MFPFEKLNARKLSFAWKINSSEKEELFLLGFILLDDKRKNKKTKKSLFWVCEILHQRKRQGVFSNLLRELQLGDREYYFKLLLSKKPTFKIYLLFS